MMNYLVLSNTEEKILWKTRQSSGTHDHFRVLAAACQATSVFGPPQNTLDLAAEARGVMENLEICFRCLTGGADFYASLGGDCSQDTLHDKDWGWLDEHRCVELLQLCIDATL